MFTTEGFLHLSLLEHQEYEEGDGMERNLLSVDKLQTPGRWALKSKSTQSIVKLSFLSHVLGSFHGYIHLKTNFENMIIPVQIRVVDPGLRVFPNKIDFGTLVGYNEKVVVPIHLHNTGDVPVRIEGTALQRHDPCVVIMVRGSRVIPPKTKVRNAIMFMYNGFYVGTFSGVLTIKTNETTIAEKRRKIFYAAKVIRGGIAVARSQTLYFVRPPLCSFEPLCMSSVPSSSSQFCQREYLNDIKNESFHVPIMLDKPRFNASTHDRITGLLSKVRRGRQDTENGKWNDNEITLWNRFLFPNELRRVHMVENSEFRIVSYPNGSVALPQESWPSIKIQFKPNAYKHHIRSYPVYIETNTTKHKITLYVDYGRLMVTSNGVEFQNDGRCDMYESANSVGEYCRVAYELEDGSTYRPCHGYHLAFGRIPINIRQTKRFTLTNPGASSIKIKSMYTHVSHMYISLMGVSRAQEVTPTIAKLAHQWENSHPSYFENFHRAVKEFKEKQNYFKDHPTPTRDSSNLLSIRIPPGHSLTFEVSIHPTESFRFDTPQAIVFRTPSEVLHFGISYSPYTGYVHVQQQTLQFKPTFPGRVEVLPITLENHFTIPIKLKELATTSNMGHIYLSKMMLEPRETAVIGQVLLSPARACSSENELFHCLPELLESTSKWSDAIDLKSNSYVTAKQVKSHSAIRNMMFSKSDLNKTSLLFHVNLKTENSTSLQLQVKSELAWPQLSTNKEVVVESRGIGNIVPFFVPVLNPANCTISVMLSYDRQASNMFSCSLQLNALSNALAIDQYCFQQWRSSLESSDSMNAFFVAPSAMRTSNMLEGATAHMGPIYFSPKNSKTYTTEIFVRNSLNYLEPVTILGVGLHSSLHISMDGNREFNLQTSARDIMEQPDVSNPKIHIKAKRKLSIYNEGIESAQVLSLGFDNLDAAKYRLSVVSSDDSPLIFPLEIVAGETQHFYIVYESDCSNPSFQVKWHDMILGDQKRSQNFVVSMSPSLLSLCINEKQLAIFGYFGQYAVAILLIVISIVGYRQYPVLLAAHPKTKPITKSKVKRNTSCKKADAFGDGGKVISQDKQKQSLSTSFKQKIPEHTHSPQVSPSKNAPHPTMKDKPFHEKPSISPPNALSSTKENVNSSPLQNLHVKESFHSESTANKSMESNVKENNIPSLSNMQNFSTAMDDSFRLIEHDVDNLINEDDVKDPFRPTLPPLFDTLPSNSSYSPFQESSPVHWGGSLGHIGSSWTPSHEFITQSPTLGPILSESSSSPKLPPGLSLPSSNSIYTNSPTSSLRRSTKEVKIEFKEINKMY